MAHQLKRRGIARVHPLAGGLERWMALDFPVQARPAPPIPALADLIPAPGP